MATFKDTPLEVALKARPKSDSQWSSKCGARAYVRTADPTTDQHLCPRCRVIDFQRIFAIDPYTLGKEGSFVFNLTPRPWRDLYTHGCSICEMFQAMITCGKDLRVDQEVLDVENPLSFGYRLRALSAKWYWRGGNRGNQDRRDDLSVVIGLYRDTPSNWLGGGRTEFFGRGVIQVGYPSLAEESQLPFLRPSEFVGKFQAEPVKRLITTCKDSHERCSPTKMRFPQLARVIDCALREIRELTPNEQYLALSYVWGQKSRLANENELWDLNEMSKLPEQLPRTIEDAIEITIALGFRFLWVDRYCINQHHSEDKKHQIGEMASVYSNAWATICALGSGDDEGIFGKSKPQSFREAAIQGTRYVWVGREFRNLLNQSDYITRGWTLQEQFCSTRCLYFTAEGVVLLCHTGVFSEDGLHDELFNQNRLTSQFIAATGKDLPDEQEESFNMLRNEYMRRNLGYETDAFNAFKAILSRLETPSYWGIPIFDLEPEVDIKEKTTEIQLIEWSFLLGLGWQGKNQKCRGKRGIDELPTWSWVTHTSEMDSGAISSCNLALEENSYFAQVHVVCPNLQLLRAGEYFSESGLRSRIPEQSLYLEVRSVVASWRKVVIKNGPHIENGDRREYLEGICLSEISHPLWNQFLHEDFPAVPNFDNYGKQDLDKTPESGQAVLLTGMFPNFGQLRWLAIREIKKNVFHREGFFEWPLLNNCSSDRVQEWDKTLNIPDESFQTIRLR